VKSRGIVITVAVVFAAVAAGAVFMYVRGIEQQNRAEAQSVPVVVSKEDIPPGTKLNPLLSAGMFTSAEFPRTVLIRGVVTSLQQLQGQETSSPILAGEQISVARLRGEAEFGGGVLGIPPHHKAVTVPLEMHRAVGGVLRAGDHVSVYTTFQEAEQTAGAAGPGDVPGVTITLVPDVQVLHVAVPQSSGLGTSAAANSLMVTLALRPGDAQRVVFAAERGQLWLGLLPPNEVGRSEPPVSFGGVSR
jgi:pilus assembly protein CpaB